MDADAFAIKESKIFKNKSTLDSSYVPESLPEREKELEEIKWQLRDSLQGMAPNNIFIYGKTGVGKTACIRKVFQLLSKKLEELNIKNVHTMYLHCAVAQSECQIIADIANFFSQRGLAPRRGWGTNDYYNFFTRTLEELSGIFIIALDEIDKLVPESENVLYNLTRANEHLLSNAKISIVGIANDLKFTEQLDPRIISSLRQREILIPPYNSFQLKKILHQRAELAFKNVLDASVISLCSALAAQEHGDARKALDLLKTAGEIAEREESNKVTEEHIRKAKSKIELDKITEIIKQLPLQSKTILLATLRIEEKIRGTRKITTGDVYEEYRNLTKRVNIPPLTQRRVSDLISELDMLGIITARNVWKGKYGRVKEIETNILPEVKDLLF